MSINQFQQLTRRQFFNILKGYNKKQTELTKQSWEQTRIIAYYSATFDKKVPKITEFLPFPWEQNQPTLVHKKLKTQKELKKHFDDLDNKQANGKK